MSPEEKRDNVKKDYDLIAEQYGKDFGTYIEDLDIYQEFEKELPEGATILDLGAGTGRTYAYFSERGFKYVGLDFSSKMRDEAFKIHGEFPYILDDMVNIKKHFVDNSVDAVFAVYSLFHLPPEDLKKVFNDIYDILKPNGVLLFTYQLGKGEEFADEPYLGEKGKNALYMSYQTDEDIEALIGPLGYTKVYKKEKVETVDGSINNGNNITSYKILKK
ncbi:MAG: class I SAM-dependent methyltransferase [Bacilli bacterium]|nr:class I SAM-dependent methyltransferase [Bacilli bacterium]